MNLFKSIYGMIKYSDPEYYLDWIYGVIEIPEVYIRHDGKKHVEHKARKFGSRIQIVDSEYGYLEVVNQDEVTKLFKVKT